MDNFDVYVNDLLRNYIDERNKLENKPLFPYQIYIVWKCKTLQNWKYLMGTTLPDNMYYELTYNGDKEEFYLDAYSKIDNKVIKK